jgi:CHASE2 domain-containing sensor protein
MARWRWPLAPPNTDRLATPASDPASPRVRILAILGHSDNIDVERDRALLQALPNADVTFLVEPDRGQLTDQLWEQPWDLLFFAGHSTTDAQAGRLYINATDALTIDELRYGLRQAISRGLQLAIFNSCDGLGLAQSLGDLQLPQMIVMREPVPDAVAQQFLLYFLQAFAADTPFYQAVRQARERLQGSELEFPCATWLPVVYQQSTALPPSWADLAKRDRPAPTRPNPLVALVGGGLVAALVIAARLAGLLQGAELAAYDHLMRLKPDQGLDDRLLIVEVTAADVVGQDGDDRRGATLSDATLEQLLGRLMAHNPRVIALDFFRDFSVQAGHDDLVDLLQDRRVVNLCSHGGNGGAIIPSPPEVPSDRAQSQVGFSNFPPDDDDVIRRYLLHQNPAGGSPCPALYSLGLLSVIRYLAQQDIQLGWTDTDDPAIQLQDVVFSPIPPNFGAYQGLDARGHQIMLNYPAAADGIARTVTLQDILNDEVDPSWIEDRLVLIGTVDPTSGDRHPTPVTPETRGRMFGVHLHAHGASQLLRTVLDGQPLIWSWSPAGGMVWILAWGLAGGGLAWAWRSPRNRGLAVVAGGVLLYGASYGLFLLGGWIPLVPAALALGGGLVGGAVAPAVIRRFQPTD